MTAQFFATVANSVLVSQFEKVKKSKAWRHLPNPKSATRGNFESLDEESKKIKELPLRDASGSLRRAETSQHASTDSRWS